MNLIELTADKLKALKENNELIPGQTYCVIDYKPAWSGNNFIMTGNQFDIIITAISSNKVSKTVSFRHHEGDTYFKDSEIDKWKGEIDTTFTDLYLFVLGKKVDKKLYSAYLTLTQNKFVKNNNIYFEYKLLGDTKYLAETLYSLDFPLTKQSKFITNSGEEFTYNFLNIEVEKVSILITKLTDEFGNTCNYDFKNTCFTGSFELMASTGYGYTFGSILDRSLTGSYRSVEIIKEC